MRGIVLVLSLFIIATISYLAIPDSLDATSARLSATFRELISPQQITFTGFKFVEERDLRSKLPEDGTIVWWWFNREQVESQLSRHPMITAAKISRCGGWFSRCFNVEVKERKLSHIAYVGAVPWLVGDGQTFIQPLPSVDDQSIRDLVIKRYQVDLPVVRGLATQSGSPELALSRLSYVVQAIRAIEEQSALKVKNVDLTSRGELIVSFTSYDMRVTFDYHVDDLARFSDQVARLRTVLDKFGDDSRRISSIDLAFNQIGVVRLKDGGLRQVG